jgi:hypothetical protein
MKALFGTLSEKDRHCYTAVEADKLGHGGIDYIAALFSVAPKTFRQGLLELDDENEEELTQNRVRGKLIRSRSSTPSALRCGGIYVV